MQWRSAALLDLLARNPFSQLEHFEALIRHVKNTKIGDHAMDDPASGKRKSAFG